MYTAYAWKPAQDTPLMSKQVHRLCVEISQDSHRNVDISGELLQLFRRGFGGVVGGNAARGNVKCPRRRVAPLDKGDLKAKSAASIWWGFKSTWASDSADASLSTLSELDRFVSS